MARSWTCLQMLCYWTTLFTAPLLLFSAVDRAYSTRVMPTVNSSTANITVRDRDVGPLLVVPSGEDVTLFAVVTADPCPTIHWKLNGSTTIRQSDVYTIGNPCHPDGLNSAFYNFTITINVTTETAGYYTAQFNNVAGVADVPAVFVTPPVPVVVTGIQFLSSPPAPPCLLNGTTVTIKCVTSGFPRPQITFKKDSVVLDVGTISNFVQLNYTLNITVVQTDDQGVYSCTARDGDTELSHSPSKRLLFCTLPTILKLQVPGNRIEGERNVVLNCSFTGIPTAMVHWEKNGEKIPSTWRRNVNSSQPGLLQLEIRILIFTDGGEYTCVVKNIAGVTGVTQHKKMIVEVQRTSPLLTVRKIIGLAVGSVVGIILITLVVTILLCWYTRKGGSPSSLKMQDETHQLMPDEEIEMQKCS